jgi:hypothetical protein
MSTNDNNITVGQVRRWSDTHPNDGTFFIVTKLFLDIRCECRNVFGGSTFVCPTEEIIKYSEFAG